MSSRRLLPIFAVVAAGTCFVGLGAVTAAAIEGESAAPHLRLVAFMDAQPVPQPTPHPAGAGQPARRDPAAAPRDVRAADLVRLKTGLPLGNAAGPLALGAAGLFLLIARRR